MTLRKFPYPYHCALAICSDIDGTSRERFLELHEFLNTKRNTKWGKGLGLEIGDSFWMYSAHTDTDDGWSYFEGLGNQKSEDSELIKKFVQNGYIDCLHTYGQFSQKGGFHRGMAKHAIKELIEQDMHVTVWINHGDNHNFQNMGNHGWGDLPYDVSADGAKTPSLEYHTDLTIPYGIKYVWFNATSELTSIIGQDRPYGVKEYYFSDGVLRHPRRLLMIFWRKLKGRSIPLPHDGCNKLLRLVELRDGQRVYAFRRFGCWGKGKIEHLAELLSEANLEELKRVQGYMITYVHMGKSTSDEALPENVCSTLRRLAERFLAGDIYVTTTAKLLQYNLVYHSLDWEVRSIGKNIEIHLNGIEDGLIEGTRTPTLEELSGITFYTSDAERTEVVLDGRKIKTLKNPVDYLGLESVMIPIHCLICPSY